MNNEHARVYKKWIDSGKRARLTERESILLAEIQSMSPKRTVPIIKNEIKAFHDLINNAFDY